MTGDPRWTDETQALVARAIQDAEIDDPGSYTLADAALEALAVAGLLLPPGGVTEPEGSWSHADGTDCINEDCYDRRPVRRTVTTWPNGDELVTPWRRADG